MELSKTYQPQQHEDSIYGLWEQSGAFKPKGKGRPFSLIVPPPNANGDLHIGHALAFALQDITARYHRSTGDRVLFVPGADHAGFETQVVYERLLEKQGKSRFLYSREQMYEQIKNFVNANKTNFETQIRNLGTSVDWEHFKFSLDDSIIKQAYITFRSLWNDGLIYRGKRLVNFCTFHGTAFADIEVEYQDEASFLWYIKYPLVSEDKSIVVATTRPETMLGDTAIAVNPKDERYGDLIGKTVKVPLTNREIPIIADSYVDSKFGSGAVKITPAHDPNDFEIGQRHDLPLITIISFEGKLNHNAPEQFRQLTVLEGREAILKELKIAQLIVDCQDYNHSVAHCYKCNTIIEPLLMDQWFINTKPLAEKAINALSSNKIDFLPKAKAGQLITYLKNIKDWNISRQISWGIPIPAFQNETDPDDWIYSEEVTKECIEVNNNIYRRDPDVFDTWFSSSSWPYAALNYPGSQDFKDFFPLDLMETGVDILMPWVSRMIMLSLYETKEIPFKKVYLHGMVIDEHGQKMSKSKGNVISPIEIAKKYGSDALRIGIISGQTPGSNQPYAESKVIGGRNFCNKLWNIARYIESSQLNQAEKNTSYQLKNSGDHYIINRYNKSLIQYKKLMDSYRYHEAYELIYHFIKDDFADWYLETDKIYPNHELISFIFKASLVLLHPFAPFITETIWQQQFSSEDNKLLATSELVEINPADKKYVDEYSKVKDLIIAIRAIIKSTGAKNVKLYHQDDQTILSYSTLISRLAAVSGIESIDLGKGVAVNNPNFNCWLDIPQSTIDNYVNQLQTKIKNCQQVIQNLKTRLSNTNYLKNAPSSLVQASQDQLAQAERDMEAYIAESLRYHHN